MAEPTRGKQAFDRTWDEYSLLQGKIDRIGAFKFQIRGWVISFVFVGLVGIQASDASLSLVWWFLPFTVLMWILEHDQALRGHRYGKRCQELERVFVRSAGRGAMRSSLPQVARRSRVQEVEGGWQGAVVFLCEKSSHLLFGGTVLVIVVLGIVALCDDGVVDDPTEPVSVATCESEEHLVGEARSHEADEHRLDPDTIGELLKVVDEIPEEVSCDDEVFDVEMAVDEVVAMLRESLDDDNIGLFEALEVILPDDDARKSVLDAAAAFESVMAEWSYDEPPERKKVQGVVVELKNELKACLEALE